MRYALLILGSTFVFSIVGLVAAWGSVEYYQSGRTLAAGDDFPLIAFIALPLGGLITGLVVGCVAALLGNYLTQHSTDPLPRKGL